MALKRREINNTDEPLLDPEGRPIQGGKITFQLVHNGVPAGDVDTDSKNMVLSLPNVSRTNDNGEFSINLWPNDRGTRNTKYLCKLPDGSFCQISLPDGDEPIKWSELISGTVIGSENSFLFGDGSSVAFGDGSAAEVPGA